MDDTNDLTRQEGYTSMQIFDQAQPFPNDALDVLTACCPDEKERFCFFDIETTGLSPKISSLYLIGVLWYDAGDGLFHTRQWFADDYISEKDIIGSFTRFLSGFTTLVHYNGSGFDIPYIEKKCREHSLDSPFQHIKSFDVFREIRALKSLFHTPDLKLATVETLVGFARTDLLSGRDCIQVYSNFMQKKYFRDNEAMESEREKLLLHNKEDLAGTYLSAGLLAYQCPAALERAETSGYTVRVVYRASAAAPFSLFREGQLCQEQPALSRNNGPSQEQPSLSQNGEPGSFFVRFEKNRILLQIPLWEGTLCHFFPNYKDYYYLPAEDTAIHKSVGAYVEPQFREQAKASNCQVKKEGIFVPIPKDLSAGDLLLFRSGYKSKQQYVLWDEKTEQDTPFWESLLLCLIRQI